MGDHHLNRTGLTDSGKGYVQLAVAEASVIEIDPDALECLSLRLVDCDSKGRHDWELVAREVDALVLIWG